MSKSRTQKAKLNMFFSLLQQGVAFVCGLIIPKMMITAFGSTSYGVTASVANFLAYVTLLEGGIGAVTRSALYRAFAHKSDSEVSSIITETKGLYRRIAYIFIIYVLVLAALFKLISPDDVFSYWYSFGLVLVIAISSFASYFIGITYSLLLQADQKNYIVAFSRIITTILNTVVIVVLIRLNSDLLIVKLVSSLIFVLRPIMLWAYVKKHYNIQKVQHGETHLKDKGSALGQHIAWTLHNNTDITVLTVFKDYSLVSVYTVYHNIVYQLQNILYSFTSGMEAVFGSMLRNEETTKLKKTFCYYETFISLISVTLLSSAMVLIVPFIRLYTAEVTDADYINLGFGIMLIIATLLYIMRSPYEHMVIAAGHFRETQNAAYGEAITNILLSVVLVIKFGLIGVAIGTVVATMFRFVYYAIYLSKKILSRSILLWIKRMIINLSTCAIINTIGNHIINYVQINNYMQWALAGMLIVIVSFFVTLLCNIIVYKEDVIEIRKRGIVKKR